MQRSTWLAIVLAVLVFVAFVIDDTEENIHTVAVRTWSLEERGTPRFPELDDPSLAVPWLADRPSLGFAFSGGGTRSASATLGQLRALTALGWMEKARHITANSGGSWVTVPYTYLPVSFSEDRFLGPYIPPDELTDANLRPADVDELAFSTAIHGAGTAGEILEVGRGDEAYSDIVASIFLEPFGLHDNNKFFTFHRAALDAALAGNPNLADQNFQLVQRDGRPYPVVTGVMLGQQMSDDPDEYFPVEMTPLYTGVRGRFELEKDGETVVVGGGYVESFGYDSYEPEGRLENGRWSVQITGSLARGDKPVGDRYRFTLSDVIGTSSAAPLGTLSRNFVPNFLFPEFRHWPVDRTAISHAPEGVRRQADEFQHGDGADMDNLSVTSLLVRQTESIIAFVNTSTPFVEPPGGCGNVTGDYLTDDLISLFQPIDRLVHNVMFAERGDGLRQICESFTQKKEAGEPLVHCQAYEVLQNDWYRVEPYVTNVCWVYLDRVGQWLDRLDPRAGELVADIVDSEGSFDSFPHYSTFAEHGIRLIDLNRQRVVALSNLAAWTVLESAPYLSSSLPAAGLPTPENE